MTYRLLDSFTDILGDPDEIGNSQPNQNSQPLSLSSIEGLENHSTTAVEVTADSKGYNCMPHINLRRPIKGTGQRGEFRSIDEIDEKYRNVFSYPFFNLVQSRVIEDALYSDKSLVLCAPTGSGKTVVFEMAIVHLLMELEDKNEDCDFKIIYMAPVKALCTERLTEWYSKFTKLGLLCIEVTGDTDVDFSQLNPYRIIITTPEKWDMLTRRWRDHRQLVEVIKLFLIDEVHILNDETRGPVLEAVVSRMKTIETSVQTTHRIEQLQHQYNGTEITRNVSPNIRFVAVSATVSNPEDVAAWLGTADKPAVYYKFGDECRPVKLRRVVEGYPCAQGTSIFKFDLILNYKLWSIIQKYHDGKPTLIFCNTRKSVAMTAETLSREITISFNEEQKTRLTALASTIKNKKLQMLVLSGVGCHHAGLLYEERVSIENAFRNRDLPILITTTTLAMGVNLPAHLVIIKNTQQYVSGAYQEYSISTVLQMVGRAGRPQFDTEATAVIMTRLCDKPRYQALVGGNEPLQSYLHKRLPENLNSEAALGTVCDVAQCVQWLRSTFLSVRAAKDPKRYLGLPQTAPHPLISKKIEELCVKAMNSLASSGLITMDEACCIESTEAGRLMSIYYLDLETMKHIMKIEGSESLDRLLWIVCESHELSDMHLRIDERRCLNALNRNNTASTIRFPMKGKITTRQMKLNCVIQAILGCLPIPDPSLNQEATKIMRIADRVCKCLVAYVTRPALISQQPKYYSAVLNSIILAKCVTANLWENSPFVSKQLRGIGPAFSTLLATAGKVNFMLLEESHPRDLERIMNKGPPAGNILRKQISLLPKYQLTMTPVDEKIVSLQLVLLNHHNLSENMEHLTAGEAHKSYVIIGDSENILLQLTSFSDKYLIGIYNGSITYQITRKHGFEHKIYAHCVSSAYVGIDVQCEYVFKNIEPRICSPLTNYSNDFVIKPAQKQTTITDTFRERKRKNTETAITQCKEKNKRESALFEKFKNLKESFGKTTKVLKDDLNKSAVMSEKILQELTRLEKPDTNPTTENTETNIENTFFEGRSKYEINEDDFISEFMDDDKINDILNEIEGEISKGNRKSEISNTSKNNAASNDASLQKIATNKPVNMTCASKRNAYPQIDNYKSMNNIRKRVNKTVPKKSNYNFIDLLEKNIDMSDTEDKTVPDQNSFSDAIRSHIEKYLLKAKTNVKPPNIILDLIQDEPEPSKETEPIVIIQDSNVIGKDDIDALGNSEKFTKTDGDKELIVDEKPKQVTVLQHKINSIDLTMNVLPNIDVQIDEDSELPVTEFYHENKHNNIGNETIIEKTKNRIIPENNNAENTSFNNNNELEYPKTTLVTIKSNNCEHITVNEGPNLKKQETILDINSIDFATETNKINIDRDEKRTATVPELKVQEELKEIEPLKSRELEAYAFTIPIVEDFKRAYNDKEFSMTLSSISHVRETKENQEIKIMEEWKKYIKELPPLHSQMNNKDDTDKNNFINRDIDNQKESTKENNDQKASINLPSTSPQLKENQEQAMMMLPIRKGFDPPYKIPMISDNNERLENVSAKSLEKQSTVNIESLKNKGKVNTSCSTATCNFSDQITSTQENQENYSYKVPFIKNNNIASVSEPQELLAIKQHENNNTDNIETTTNDNQNTGNIGKHSDCTQIHYGHYRTLDLPRTMLAPENKSLRKPESVVLYNSSYTRTNNQNHYINKYSFSTNKTDVLTQENTDHVVRVIKKLKIDLDIIKIFSEKNKSMANDTGFDIEDQINNEEDPSVVYKKPKLAKALINEKYNESSNSIREDFNSDLGNCTEVFKVLQNSDKLITAQKSPVNLNHLPLPATEPTQLPISDTKHAEVVKAESHCKEENAFIEYKVVDPEEESKSNNVMSILLKYSNIMRNNTKNVSDHSLSQNKTNEKTLSAAKQEKPKRPFKISDIHRLNPTPLPDVFLLEKARPVNVAEYFNVLEPNDIHDHLDQNKKLNFRESIASMPKEPKKFEQEYSAGRHEVVQNEFDKFKDITYCDSSYTENQVRETVSDIDQNMFNPKTLLQCFGKDEPETIVPPPPEFSDYLNTPLYTNTDVSVPMDCYEPMEWEEKMDISPEGIHNRSIFQDDCQVELTPSKEIETWNLFEDEVGCKTYTSPDSSTYSFTIMRKNKEPTYQSLPHTHNTTLRRHEKLKQFKFSHKNKFKP